MQGRKKSFLQQYNKRFLNWRFYKSLSGGPISDLGAHQIDIFNWALGCQPISLMASGGRSYFKEREHFEIDGLFDYETLQGNVRAFYQVLTTTSSGGGYYESFMGTNGTLVMSEREAYTKIYKESGANNEAQWNVGLNEASSKKSQQVWPLVIFTSLTIRLDPDQASLRRRTTYIDCTGAAARLNHQSTHRKILNGHSRTSASLSCDARHALRTGSPHHGLTKQPKVNKPFNSLMNIFTHKHCINVTTITLLSLFLIAVW